jgi:hypothetical protein
VILALLDAGVPLENLTNDDLMDVIDCATTVDVLERMLARNVDVGTLRDSSGGTACHRVSQYRDGSMLA